MPDRWLKRGADTCLLLTAWSIPLSTSGMQIGIAGLGILALVAWWRGMPVIRPTPLDAVLAIMVAAFAISTLASGNPLRAGGWEALWVMVGYFGVYWWLADTAAALRFVRALVLAAAVVSVYGIVQYYTGIDWYRALLGRPIVVKPRIAGAEGFAAIGFFRNYLTYAHVLVLPLGFALAARERWIRLGLVPLLALALLLSTARGAWIAAIVMAIALVAVRRRGGARLAALAAAGLLVWSLVPGFRQQLAPALTTTEANAGRVAIYAANLDIVAAHPVLGLGFGRYRQRAAPYYERHPLADRRSHAHNNFLQIAAEAGLLGLAAFMLVFATALRFGVEAVQRQRDPAARATALGGCLAVIGFLVGGLTQYTFGDVEVAIAMWASLAVLMRLRDLA